jgi:hypothetical protein
MMPEEHFSLKPNIAKVMADVCRVEVNYRPEANGLTYQCLLRLAARLSEKLEDFKPKDMIEVQSFSGASRAEQPAEPCGLLPSRDCFIPREEASPRQRPGFARPSPERTDLVEKHLQKRPISGPFCGRR